MGVLLDIQKISTDSAAAATLLGQLQTAQAAVAAIQSQIDSGNSAVTADDTQLSTDLQALPSPVFVLNPDGSASVYAYSAAPPGFTIVTAQPAT